MDYEWVHMYTSKTCLKNGSIDGRKVFLTQVVFQDELIVVINAGSRRFD